MHTAGDAPEIEVAGLPRPNDLRELIKARIHEARDGSCRGELHAPKKAHLIELLDAIDPEEVVLEIEAASGVAIAVQADVGVSTDRTRLIDETLAKLGRLDEAVELGQRTVELEPLGVTSHQNLSFYLTPLGRYEKSVYSAIGARWYKLCDENRDRVDIGTVSVQFVVAPDGKIGNIKVISGGTSASFTNLCLQSVQDAKPEPIPEDVMAILPPEGLPGEVNFTGYSR